MAKFRFRFQPVLRQRELAERDEQLKVAEVEQQRLRLEERLRQCQQRLDFEQQALNSMVSSAAVNPRDARSQSAAILVAKGEAQRLAVELAGVYKRLESARQKLAEAATHRRSMELLRDNHKAKWRSEINAAEDRAMDELAVLRSARTKKDEL
ncbi:MAG: flagellar export protein FliJ [Phycisphaerales bacterium JB061]